MRPPAPPAPSVSAATVPARNEKALARMGRVGFELGPEIRKPEKTPGRRS